VTEIALPDLKLVGNTASAGGRFGNVRVTGEAELTGDIECRSMNCVGTIQMKGNLQSQTLRLTGECRVDGNLQAAKIAGVGEIRVSGAIRGESIRLKGSIRVEADCEAETLDVRGALDAEGLVSADRIHMRLYGSCGVKEIGGGTVVVRRARTVLLKKMFDSGVQAVELTADLIEGDSLDLEHTRVAVVRGNRVAIGPGCRVGRVEYREELRVSPSAEVAERVQL